MNGNTQIVTLDINVAANPFSIQSSTDSVTQGVPVSFSLASSVTPSPAYSSVQWDFNYDGSNFIPGGSGASATNTFNNVGNQTVAAEFTDANGSTLLVTLAVSIGTAFSIQPSSQSINQGDSVAFSLASAATPAPSYSSVQWNFNYDGTDFFSDAERFKCHHDSEHSRDPDGRRPNHRHERPYRDRHVRRHDECGFEWCRIGADSSQITAGDTVDYSLTNTAGTTPSYASVQWDFNYNGNFVADPSASGPTATATMNTTGNVVVAAKATDGSGNSQIFTFEEPVDYAPPTLTAPVGLTVTADVSVPLSVTATSCPASPACNGR